MRYLQIAAAAAALVTAALLPAQAPASATLYGAGCRDIRNTANAPVLLVAGLPQLGATVTIRYLQGPNVWPNALPILITGSSSASLPVPQLSSAMSPNCTLLVNPDIAVFPMPLGTNLAYLDRLAYQIPNIPTVLGAQVFHQWATFVTTGIDPLNQQFAYILFSNGAQITVGV